MRNVLPAFLALTLLASASACTIPGAGPVQEDNFYSLEIEDPGRSYETPLLEGTIEVSRFSADGLTGERAIIFTRDGAQFRQYNFHFWVDSPTVLVRDAMVEALRASNAVERAVTPDIRLLSDYRLTGRLQRLHHRRAGDDGEAEVRLSTEIAVTRARDGQLVMLENYDMRRPLPEDSIPAAVRELRAALTETTARLLDDLESAARPQTTQR